MPKPADLLKNILSDMKVELAEMFDRNFERKGFFGSKWVPRKVEGKGTLLHVTGKMRRSIRAAISGRGVTFTSPLPYTGLHNQGGTFAQPVRAHHKTSKKTGKSFAVKAHTRTMSMPQRQFIGDHPQVKQAITDIVHENVAAHFDNLAKELLKK